MAYSDITDAVKKYMGPCFYPLIGKLYRLYKDEFILQCIYSLPENIKEKTPKQKAVYLAGVCRNKASVTDYKENNPVTDLFNDGDFKL